MSFPSLKIGDLVAKTPIVQGGHGRWYFAFQACFRRGQRRRHRRHRRSHDRDEGARCGQQPLEANLRALRREIEKAREATQGIIGVNIMVALTTFAEMVRTSIESRPT